MAWFLCNVGGGGSVLTVECYSGFAGLTISCTDGVKTFTKVCPNTSPYEVVFEGLTNGTWTLSTVYNGVTYTETVEVNFTSQFYPIPDGATTTPTDDIQTWLHCASIFDKNYTSIAQVLADASTLLALIASNNAADYMARSTSWASSVCANQTAMVYIGNNDYCADKLLANSTWLNAICNSTYFESVLNVKVPTMISNTAPSGVASASEEDQPAYYAFDNNSGTYWSAHTSGDSYVQYDFTSQKDIYMWEYTGTSLYLPTKIVLKGSNDGTTFEDIDTVQPSSADANVHKRILNTTNTYRYYRALCTARYYSVYGYYSQLTALQFYGRDSS